MTVHHAIGEPPPYPYPFSYYQSSPVYQHQSCVGCADQEPNQYGTLMLSEVTVGALNVCRAHVRWALKVQGIAKPEEEDID